MNVREFFASQTRRGIWRVGSPLRFVFWGGVNALAGYCIYAVLILFLPYLVSYTIAYVLGIPISYFLNSKYVFVQELRWNKALKYPLVYVAHYLFGTASLYFFVQVLGINKLAAPALVLLLTIPVTYFLIRRIVRGR